MWVEHWASSWTVEEWSVLVSGTSVFGIGLQFYFSDNESLSRHSYGYRDTVEPHNISVFFSFFDFYHHYYMNHNINLI